jgi:hypothetical protein
MVGYLREIGVNARLLSSLPSCNRSGSGSQAVPIRSLHLIVVKAGSSASPTPNGPRIPWYSSYDPNRITFPFRRSFGLPAPFGMPVSAIAQTGQSDAIHSPEACASMVVRLTMPAA